METVIIFILFVALIVMDTLRVASKYYYYNKGHDDALKGIVDVKFYSVPTGKQPFCGKERNGTQ